MSVFWPARLVWATSAASERKSSRKGQKSSHTSGIQNFIQGHIVFRPFLFLKLPDIIVQC
jgi:hypothetical protein